MKNVQVIEPAENCAFRVYRMRDADFALIFSSPGQDIEFVEDFCKRVGTAKARLIVARSLTHHIDKRRANGIHGTLYFQYEHRKIWFPNKKSSDFDLKQTPETFPELFAEMARLRRQADRRKRMDSRRQ